MTATEELRLPNDTNELDMLLKERGQEHRVWPSGRVVWHDERTSYEYEPAKNHHDEYWGGILRMTMRHLTPAQAVEATLRRGKCRNVSYRLDESRFHCSECGFGCWVKDVADGRDKLPCYCPRCGREVER